MNKKKAFYFCFILLPICFSELSVWKLNAQTVKQDLLSASGVIKTPKIFLFLLLL